MGLVRGYPLGAVKSALSHGDGDKRILKTARL